MTKKDDVLANAKKRFDQGNFTDEDAKQAAAIFATHRAKYGAEDPETELTFEELDALKQVTKQQLGHDAWDTWSTISEAQGWESYEEMEERLRHAPRLDEIRTWENDILQTGGVGRTLKEAQQIGEEFRRATRSKLQRGLGESTATTRKRLKRGRSESTRL